MRLKDFTPETLAHALFEQGYFPISCRYEMVSRIDRPDWQEFMIKERYRPESFERPDHRLGEQYVRVYSRDKISGIGRQAYRLLRSKWRGDPVYKEIR